MSQKTIVLGKGYVGSFYCKKFPECLATSRNRDSDNTIIYFDLLNKNSWNNLPECDEVIWTFASANNEAEKNIAIEFYKFYCLNKRTVILSTTSAYIHKLDNEVIDEMTPLDLTNWRIKAEEELRILGASIVHLAGIFGPNRLPINWFVQGRVQDPDGIINLIHVDDIVFCLHLLLEKFKKGSRYNLCNGIYKNNYKITDELKKNKELSDKFIFPLQYSKKMNKIVSNKKLVTEILSNDYSFKSYP
ncbi:hypothetical protein [Fluviispira multicolorata]|uniref:Uncharacterized protein n=1 Tax=Fluviispira multicolorata TaxID=2654512 RepID=A0A833JDM5_9BACT|nr:hypothetical protein [Fluviispira multicolorata]KAB8028586.1 hypothetical protein GCL57_12775 [Fluviispira multicolorata]